jgi:hypothetical protein
MLGAWTQTAALLMNRMRNKRAAIVDEIIMYGRVRNKEYDRKAQNEY